MERVKKDMDRPHNSKPSVQLAERKGLSTGSLGYTSSGGVSSQAGAGRLGLPDVPFRQAPQDGPPSDRLGSRSTLWMDPPQGKPKPAGPYVNVFLDRVPQVGGPIFPSRLLPRTSAQFLRSGWPEKKSWWSSAVPNTNKPLHLGHLRNNSLGESVSRILRAAGAEVMKVNLINDRGVHICKSMLAYQKFGQGETPESTGIKSDRFVGDYYVKYAAWAKEDETAEEQAAEMLRAWEQGDPEVRRLWETMNQWAIDGISQTYEKNRHQLR
jgi:arginyl-tRNA synthetase